MDTLSYLLTYCCANTCRGQETVKHYQVSVTDGEYDIGYRTFSSLKEFVDHFNSQPLIAGKSGKFSK